MSPCRVTMRLRPRVTALATATLAATLSLALSGCSAPPRGPRVEKFVETRAVMSTLATVTLITGSTERAVAAADGAFAALDSVTALMSAHATTGDVAEINRSAHERAVPVDPATFRVLARAKEFSALSGGAFDVTVGPLIDLWKRGARDGRAPAPEEIAAARARVGSDRLELSASASSVRFASPGMHVDLGGIAKGYAVDRAVAAIQRAGVDAGIVEVGGDLRCFGRIPAELIGRETALPVRSLRKRDAPVARAPADRAADSMLQEFFPGLRRSGPVSPADPQPWPLGVQSPFGETLLGKIRIPEGGVATSGHYRRFVEIAGRHYSHILDPRSGQPVAAPASVTVIAPDALTSDALATALTVLGAERGLALAESLPGVEALIISGTEDAPELRPTTGFPRIEPLTEQQ